MDLSEFQYLHRGGTIYDLAPALFKKSLETTLASTRPSSQKPEMNHRNHVSPAPTLGFTMIKTQLSVYRTGCDTSQQSEAVSASSSRLSVYHAECTSIQRCGSQPASPTASQGLLSSPSHGVLSSKQVLSSSSREVLSSVSQGLLSTASQGLLSSSSQIGFRVAESDRISKASSSHTTPTSSVALVPSTDRVNVDFNDKYDDSTPNAFPDTETPSEEIHLEVPDYLKGKEKKKTVKDWLLKLLQKKKRCDLKEDHGLRIPALSKLL